MDRYRIFDAKGIFHADNIYVGVPGATGPQGISGLSGAVGATGAPGPQGLSFLLEGKSFRANNICRCSRIVRCCGSHGTTGLTRKVPSLEVMKIMG